MTGSSSPGMGTTSPSSRASASRQRTCCRGCIRWCRCWKRWLLGTHHGAVSFDHFDYYLDEFTFRFNRRTSRSRGKLFYRLVQHAVAVEPVPYKNLIVPDHNM